MKRTSLISLTLGLMLAAAAAQQGPHRSDRDRHDRGRDTAHVQVQRSAPQQHLQQEQQRQVWHEHMDTRTTVVVHTWRERGGYHGARIPTAYFRVHFGPTHVFRVYSMPFMVVAGRPRFQYEGYWFDVVDPVPVYWGPAWYENDDVFVVYRGGGYYLYNARFPSRPGIAISVAF